MFSAQSRGFPARNRVTYSVTPTIMDLQSYYSKVFQDTYKVDFFKITFLGTLSALSAGSASLALVTTTSPALARPTVRRPVASGARDLHQQYYRRKKLVLEVNKDVTATSRLDSTLP